MGLKYVIRNLKITDATDCGMYATSSFKSPCHDTFLIYEIPFFFFFFAAYNNGDYNDLTVTIEVARPSPSYNQKNLLPVIPGIVSRNFFLVHRLTFFFLNLRFFFLLYVVQETQQPEV